ncbi:hypothetical protein NY2A_b833R [Paramecium bursaria Chlorella virus NY2A]|uniref:Uncharacterized protein b833R n=1 Tax=Paramecium bursaria Chlorella virus NY2A TaxID=46021 RepID=A7IY08_PBCVN|nr:hypothetical protein NY2A_b833R [Paramecium bursaria Chlorella virus NY2A]YP_001498830.1 hypothetical protein AR158_C749R [Paramecium bursaria Chlorella virus AR158]ABT15232.1 hypothetical protein NY2A_b833R [Paramecium bursaria Chlorella virus NY2A]ABU44294.1 hypothetical protein AR158_C749R [Paramecium bursaria Chlorella virus AR158]
MVFSLLESAFRICKNKLMTKSRTHMLKLLIFSVTISKKISKNMPTNINLSSIMIATMISIISDSKRWNVYISPK